LDLSGVEPVVAVAAVTRLPPEFVALGLPPILKSKAIVLDGDRLVQPKYIESQEAKSTDAARVRKHRAKLMALENRTTLEQAIPKTTPITAARDVTGRYITYFVQAGTEEGPIKIGTTSRDVVSRIEQLQCGNAEVIWLLGCIDGKGSDYEATLHEKFKDFRKNGEWFEPAPELLSFIACNASLHPDVTYRYVRSVTIGNAASHGVTIGNPTLRYATQRKEEEACNGALHAPPNATRIAEAKKASLKRRRGKRGTIQVELDDRPSDPSLFALPPEERKSLDRLLSSSSEADRAKRDQIEEKIEGEVLRVFRYQRHRATGIDFPLLRGKDAQKWRAAARKFGAMCISYGMTPESVIAHWSEHNWTEQKFPTLMWLAGTSQMDQAAMALLPTRGPSRKKGPKEAVDGKNWEEFGDDFETLVGADPGRRRARSSAAKGKD
jgi:hypothetical protein